MKRTGPLIILKGATRAQCCCAGARAKANTGRGWLSLPSQTSKTGDQFSLCSSKIPGSATHTHTHTHTLTSHESFFGMFMVKKKIDG